MNNKKSKIWVVLFYLCFAAVIISTGVLVKYYRGYRAANNQYEVMQADVNDEAEENIEVLVGSEDAELVYAKEDAGEALEENGVYVETEEVLNANTANIANPIDIAMGEIQKADMQNNAMEGISGISASEGLNAAGVSEDASVNATGIESYDIKIPQKALDWDALHEQNADIYAWIYVPDTKVDYPILQHPTDNSYYLNYNIDGTKGFPGCIYTENYNKKDFSDVHTVIYGHNLKDKTMFTSLHNFENDELFAKEHYIYIYTQDYVYVYRIFAAYEFSAIHLLDNYDFTNEYVYEDFLKKIYNTTDRVANVKQDIKVTAKDKIVTLSTCTKDSDASKRFLVTGVLINPKE